MYNSNVHASYEKFSGGAPPHQAIAPPLEPPVYGPQGVSTGIPVNSSGSNFYSEFSLPPPPPPPPPHVPLQIQRRKRGPWSTSLFGCFSDPGNCCLTCCLPCITFGRIAEIVDEGSSTCLTMGALYALICCCCCCLSCCYRRKLRQKFSLNGNFCTDCLVHSVCCYCALCQEFRELKNQGYEVAMGWQGNAEKHKRDTQMVPVSTEGMTR